MADTYSGTCFCGAVAIEAKGEPKVMGYCHCRSCRSWSAGPVNAFTLWAPEDVTVTRGQEHLKTYSKTEMSHRQFCAQCGGHVMALHPPLKMADVYAATIPAFPFAAQAHINYAEAVLPIHDGLPKFKDFPAEFGGSGEMIPE